MAGKQTVVAGQLVTRLEKQAGEASRSFPPGALRGGNMPWGHLKLRLFVKYSLKEAGEMGEKWPRKDTHTKSLEFVCECDYIWRKGLCRCE